MALRCPNKPGWEGSVDWLIEQMTLYNDQCISTMVMATPDGNTNECRLNNAGLKMYWHKNRADKLIIKIGGDQAYMYPEFVIQFRALVKKFGYYDKTQIQWRDIK